MTDLAIGVILKADNSALVRALKGGAVGADEFTKVVEKAAAPLGEIGREATAAGQKVSEMGAASAAGAEAMVSAAKRASNAHSALNSSSKDTEKQLARQRYASMQLGQQLQDMAVQAQMGTSWFTIMAQQGGQTAFALQGLEGSSSRAGNAIGKAATFISGPWGLALAAVVYGIAKFTQAMNDHQVLALKDTLASNGLSDAQDVLGKMFDLSTGKIKEQNEMIRTNIQLTAMRLRSEILADKQDIAEASKKAGQKSWIGFLRDPKSWDNGWNGLGQTAYINDVKETSAKKLIDQVTKDPKTAVSALKAAEKLDYKNSNTDLQSVVDAIRKAATLSERERNQAELQKAADTSKLPSMFLEPKKERAKKAGSSGEQLSDIVGDRLLGSAQKLIGLNENADKGTLESLFKKANLNVDPTKTAWCAAFVNAVLATNGMAGTGQLNARSFLEYGKHVDAPEKGDIVVLKRGNDASKGHVGFYAGEDKKGNVLITGGNQGGGKSVTTSAFRKSDVLDYRRVLSGDESAQQADTLKNFGEQSADKIAQLRGQFDELPRGVDQANTAIRETNKLIAELSEKHPPGFEAMIDQAKQLEPLIRESLRKPILNMIADGERQIEIGNAQIANDGAQSEALRFTNQLMDMLGVKSEAQLATELAKRGISHDQVVALYGQLDIMREQSRELDKQAAKQQNNLGLLGDVQSSLRDGIAGIMNGQGVDGIGTMVSHIFDGFKNAMANEINDALFGDMFRKQEDKIKGIGEVSAAGERLASQVDTAKSELEKFAEAVAGTTAAITPTAQGGGTTANAIVGATASANGAPIPMAMEGVAQKITDAGGEIVVTAKQTAETTLHGTMRTLLGTIFSKETAGTIADGFTTMMKGAAIGTAVSGTLNSIGIKSDNTGAQVGGALGSTVFKAVLPGLFKSLGDFAGPIGSIAGSILGGIVGGLFGSSHTGSAKVSFADGAYGAGKTGGNDASLQGKSSGLANNIGTSLTSIADQLGGVLSGRGSLSIGYNKKGEVVVDPTGANRVKGNGVQNFGKDGEAAATAYALMQELKDGAVSGLSAAVSQALTSGSDIEKSIREALKVDDIEQILQGFSGESKKAFVDFERQAKERMRIAGKYGFDLVKLEEDTQKKRKALLDDAVDKATGGLKQLMEDMLSGEKAGGTLNDRRLALIEKANAIKGDAATDPAAASKLATILDQLYSVSLDANGSAGAAFAGDRSLIKTTAQTIIDQATADITAAQNLARTNAGTDSATTDAILADALKQQQATAAYMDENNSQNAQMIALLRQLGLSGIINGGNGLAAAYGIGGSIF